MYSCRTHFQIKPKFPLSPMNNWDLGTKRVLKYMQFFFFKLVKSSIFCKVTERVEGFTTLQLT